MFAKIKITVKNFMTCPVNFISNFFSSVRNIDNESEKQKVPSESVTGSEKKRKPSESDTLELDPESKKRPRRAVVQPARVTSVVADLKPVDRDEGASAADDAEPHLEKELDGKSSPDIGAVCNKMASFPKNSIQNFFKKVSNNVDQKVDKSEPEKVAINIPTSSSRPDSKIVETDLSRTPTSSKVAKTGKRARSGIQIKTEVGGVDGGSPIVGNGDVHKQSDRNGSNNKQLRAANESQMQDSPAVNEVIEAEQPTPIITKRLFSKKKTGRPPPKVTELESEIDSDTSVNV